MTCDFFLICSSTPSPSFNHVSNSNLKPPFILLVWLSGAFGIGPSGPGWGWGGVGGHDVITPRALRHGVMMCFSKFRYWLSSQFLPHHFACAIFNSEISFILHIFGTFANHSSFISSKHVRVSGIRCVICIPYFIRSMVGVFFTLLRYLKSECVSQWMSGTRQQAGPSCLAWHLLARRGSTRWKLEWVSLAWKKTEGPGRASPWQACSFTYAVPDIDGSIMGQTPTWLPLPLKVAKKNSTLDCREI